MLNSGNENILFAGIILATGYFFLLNSLLYLIRWNDVVGMLSGGVLLVFSYISLYAGIVKSELIFSMPWLFGSDIVATTVILGLMSITVSINALPQFEWKKSYLVFVFVPLLMLALLLFNSKGSSDEQLQIITNSISRGAITHFFDPLSFYLYLLIHLIATVYVLYKFAISFKLSNVPTRQVPAVILGGMALLVCILLMGYFQIRNVSSVIFSWGLSAGEFAFFYSTIFVFYLFFQIWPYYFKHGPVYFDARSFKIDRYKTPYLKNIDIDNISTRLDSVMEEKKLFMNEDVSLAFIAENIGITQHQLSTFLNQHRNQNFPQFINYHRINEAKKILSKNKDANILKLSYDVGYNSPSAFYRAFKNETGLSPRQWLTRS